ncbi:MAG: Spy/CpxP family protein refolding chaperone [Desulfobacterales bacterium]|jgi:Spy/CpxP family protein refolding chaperone|nr:Spy/CpxP family protein refolding chaperone [Desulfobacterales bacterium]
MMTTSVKQNLFRVAILLLIGIFLVPAIASAFRNGDRNCEKGMGMHGKGMQWESYHMWDNPKVVEELGLTDEQVGELKEADLAMKENHMELRSQLNELNLEMDIAFSEKTVDDSKVIELANKISEIRNQLFMDRVESRLKMTKILTAEQLEKLETLQPGPCEGRGKFGKYDKRCKDNWKNDTTRQ